MGGANLFAAQQVAGRAAAPPAQPEVAVDPQTVEHGRDLIVELTELVTSDPNVMLALKDDLVGFGMAIKQVITGGQQGPPPGMGPQGPPPGMGQQGPPMGGPPPGMGGGGMPPMGG